MAKLVRKAIGDAGVPEDAVQFVDNPDRSLVDAMLGMKDHIDLLIPRGGDGLIRFVAENATMPAVTGGIGVCHTYIDRGAELDMAATIVKPGAGVDEHRGGVHFVQEPHGRRIVFGDYRL